MGGYTHKCPYCGSVYDDDGFLLKGEGCEYCVLDEIDFDTDEINRKKNTKVIA